jgi:hypothetical protein
VRPFANPGSKTSGLATSENSFAGKPDLKILRAMKETEDLDSVLVGLIEDQVLVERSADSELPGAFEVWVLQPARPAQIDLHGEKGASRKKRRAVSSPALPAR